MHYKITESTSADTQAIKTLLDQAFEQPDEGTLVEKLLKSDHFIPELSLLAWNGETLVAYLLFTLMHIETTAGLQPSLALAPIAVSPSCQKQGIGQWLINHGLGVAKKLGHESVIVLGHAAYYPKFGFQPASNWGITCPFPVPDEVFMALELKSGSLENAEGKAVYAPEFSS